MFKLRTLGGLGLKDTAGRDLGRVLVQPKLVGLLTYLAGTTPQGFRRRDSLLTVFWPELDTAHARSALRQSFYTLRRELGDGLIGRRGDEEVGIDPARLTYDVWDFGRDVDSGESDRAIARYKGDFLSGFFLGGAPEFERWVEKERAHLARGYGRALERSADVLAERGDREQALERWYQLIEREPYNSRVALRLMETLDAVGNRGEAIAFGEKHAALLQQELGAAPDPAITELIERLRSEPTMRPAGITNRAQATKQAATKTRRTSARVVALSVLVTTVVAAATFAWWSGRTTPATVALDPHAIAIMPFRIAAADPALEYLGEGMVDLLHARITGQRGPRSVAPQSVMSAWRKAGGTYDYDQNLPEDAELEIARAVGAGQLLTGGIVGSESHLELSAILIDVESREVRARASVAGAVNTGDRLLSLVDELAARLLTERMGVPTTRFASMTPSLPAVKSYIAGNVAYREGRYLNALADFETAIELDSTFALAALYASFAAGWVGRTGVGPYLRLAMAHRDRLEERDRMLLDAADAYHDRPPGESYAVIERTAETLRDQPQALFILADFLYHHGLQLGLEHPQALAEIAFRKALELDSEFEPALDHLLDIYMDRGDTSTVRQMGARYISEESLVSRPVRYWGLATVLSDTAALEAWRDKIDQISVAQLRQITGWSERLGLGLDNGLLAATKALERAVIPRQRRISLMRMRSYLLNTGRPAAAAKFTKQLAEVPRRKDEHLWLQVTDGVFWDGDSAATEHAMRRLLPYLDVELSPDSATRYAQYNCICGVGLWHAHYGDRAVVQRALVKLRDGPPTGLNEEACQAILEALLADSATLASKAARLDSISWTIPATGWPGTRRLVHFTLAEVLERVGDLNGALAAIRRSGRTSQYRSTYLREEGRLAAMVGEREVATRAYEDYLRLQFEPEPQVREEVDRVQAELARLLDEADVRKN